MQPQDHLVLGALVPPIIVQLDRKHQGIAHHHVAVPIQDLSPGSNFVILADHIGIDVCGNIGALDQLQLDHAVNQRRHHQQHHAAQGDHSGSSGSHALSSVNRR